MALVPFVSGGDRLGAVTALAVAAVAATLIALSGYVRATWWAVALFGSEYAVSLYGRATIDLRASILAAALLALAELIQWSARARSSVGNENGEGVARLYELGALCFGSIALGALVLSVAGASRSGGLELTVIGLVASVSVLGLVLALAIRAHAAQRGGGGRWLPSWP